jgi:hypothetical protein
VLIGSAEGMMSSSAARVLTNLAFGCDPFTGVGMSMVGGFFGGGFGGGVGWLTPRTAHLIGFQGVGINKANYATFYGEWGARVLPDEHGLIKAGHFGYSLNRGRTIYGFFPSRNAIARVNQMLADEPFINKGKQLQDAFDYLNMRLPIQGQWRDDTGIFQHAHNLAPLTGGRTSLVHTTFQVSNAEYYQIRDTLRTWVAAGETLPMFYRFPYKDSPMPVCYNNCLTALRMLNPAFVLNPNQTGMVSQALPDLQPFKPPWFWLSKELPQ